MSKFAPASHHESVFVHISAINGLEAQNPLIQKGDLQGSSAMSLEAIDQVMAGYQAEARADSGLSEVSTSYEIAAATPLAASSTLVMATPNIVENSITDLILTGDSNYSLGTAHALDTLTGLKANQGYVGGFDSVDYFKFDLSAIRDLTLSLTGMGGNELTSNLSLRLIKDHNNNGQIDSGEVISSSNRSGFLNESLNKVLSGGTYYAEVKNLSGSGNYEFRSYAKLPQVNVDISRVTALNSGIDFGSKADFYSKITIDGNTRTTGSISNDNDISPNWSHSKTVDGTSRYVSVGIQMWDSDGGLAGADDRVDVDAGAGRDINVWYDLLTNQITGDVSGTGSSTLTSSGNSGDRARTYFKVTEGDWYDRNLGDNHLTNLARNAGTTTSRNEMLTLLRDTKDYGSITSTELTDLRTIVSDRYQPEYVDNLAGKVLNGDVANARSGIGNLYGGASATRMESLIGKWFLGSDRPTASGTYTEASGSLFRNGISINDLDQGSVGDCYFLAALGAAAKDKSHIISNMFTDNGDGTFTVKFYKPNGSRDYVTVDRFLPTTAGGNFIYANRDKGLSVNSANNELWVALAEKAYAQVNESGWIGQDNTNSYSGIAFGWMDKVINQISGLSTTSQNATNMTKSELINLVNSNKMLTAGFVSGANYGVVNSHAYTLTAYNAATGKFHLHNPWGGSHADVTWAELQDLQGVIQYSNF